MLIALGLTLVGVFLPWVGSASLATLTGWALPTIGVLLVAVVTILFVTTPGRPVWLGTIAAGLSFVMAVLASVVMAVVLVFAPLLRAVESAAAMFGGGATGTHASVSVGGWLTVAAAVAGFLGTLRLLLETRQEA